MHKKINNRIEYKHRIITQSINEWTFLIFNIFENHGQIEKVLSDRYIHGHGLVEIFVTKVKVHEAVRLAGL